jgi:hypothetical protein
LPPVTWWLSGAPAHLAEFLVLDLAQEPNPKLQLALALFDTTTTTEFLTTPFFYVADSSGTVRHCVAVASIPTSQIASCQGRVQTVSFKTIGKRILSLGCL